jgi:hypothetical protein
VIRSRLARSFFAFSTATALMLLGPGAHGATARGVLTVSVMVGDACTTRVSASASSGPTVNTTCSSGASASAVLARSGGLVAHQSTFAAQPLLMASAADPTAGVTPSGAARHVVVTVTF